MKVQQGRPCDLCATGCELLGHEVVRVALFKGLRLSIGINSWVDQAVKKPADRFFLEILGSLEKGRGYHRSKTEGTVCLRRVGVLSWVAQNAGKGLDFRSVDE